MKKQHYRIPFNKPFLTGNETEYITDAVRSGKISGNGKYTKLCQSFFESRYGFKKCVLTTSCTDALEMAAILINIKEGDEVIVPSYTFVSTANAFVLRGAKIVFADSLKDNPNIDSDKIEALITERTRAIVPVHYAGIACDMEKIMSLAEKYNLYVVEDAAHAIDSYYKNRPLGGIGHLATFSFHETKNINSGEGGMLVVNDEQFIERSELIWEKGTNRSAFWRGEVDKYEWVDIGSSYLPSEIISAFLYAQLEKLDEIQDRRKNIWNNYYRQLSQVGVKVANNHEDSTNNAHMFYLICNDLEQRSALINYLSGHGIYAVFHYLSLHKSPFHLENNDPVVLENSESFEDCLVRLPLYFDLTEEENQFVIDKVIEFLA